MPKKNSIDAINPLMDRGDLVGDFSRKQALPTTTAGRHSDLKYISTQTMVDMLQGKIPIGKLTPLLLVLLRILDKHWPKG